MFDFLVIWDITIEEWEGNAVAGTAARTLDDFLCTWADGIESPDGWWLYNGTRICIHER